MPRAMTRDEAEELIRAIDRGEQKGRRMEGILRDAFPHHTDDQRIGMHDQIAYEGIALMRQRGIDIFNPTNRDIAERVAARLMATVVIRGWKG